MAQSLLTKESPEIIQFLQNIDYLSSLLDTDKNVNTYRPVLKGERYLTEAELSELLKVTRRTLVEHRTTGKLPFYRFGGRILYKESDITRILEENKMQAFKEV